MYLPQVALHDDVVDDVNAHVGDEDEEEVARDAAPAALHREHDGERAVDGDHGDRQHELVPALGPQRAQVAVPPHRPEHVLHGVTDGGGGYCEMSKVSEITKTTKIQHKKSKISLVRVRPKFRIRTVVYYNMGRQLVRKVL